MKARTFQAVSEDVFAFFFMLTGVVVISVSSAISIMQIFAIDHVRLKVSCVTC